MLCEFLLYSKVEELYVYIYYPLLNLPPTHSLRSSESTKLGSLVPAGSH